MLERKAKQKKHRATFALILGIIFSIALLFVLFRGVEWDTLIGRLRDANPAYLLLYVIFPQLSMIVRGYRSRFLIPGGERLPTLRLTEAAVISIFLPLRAGEIVRPMMMRRWLGVPFGVGIASVATERVFDVLVILLFLWFGLRHSESPPEWVMIAAQSLAILAVVIGSVMILATFFGNWLEKLAHKIVGLVLGDGLFAKKLDAIISEIITGLSAVKSLPRLALVIFWSAVLWGTIACSVLLVILAFGETPSIWMGLTVTSMIALAVAAPSAPGFIGTYQLGCTVALCTIYNYPRELGLAVSIVMHALGFLPTVVWAAVVMLREGVKFSELTPVETNSLESR